MALKRQGPDRRHRASDAGRAGLRAETGFTLLETIVSMGLLATALLGVVALMGVNLRHASDGPMDLIAKQKASEAIEAVYAARDNRVVRWAQICNADAGGVFLNGPQPLRLAGPDGLVNTGDDGALEQMVTPGPDNILGTPDDQRLPLDGLTREIVIQDVGPNLRRITVTVTYPTSLGPRPYILTTLISSFA